MVSKQAADAKRRLHWKTVGEGRKEVDRQQLPARASVYQLAQGVKERAKVVVALGGGGGYEHEIGEHEGLCLLSYEHTLSAQRSEHR